MPASPEGDAPAPQPRKAAPPTRIPAPAVALEFMGVHVRCLVSAEETGGDWTLLEYTAPPRFAGPAPHVHRRTTELFYVVRGKLTLEADGVTREVGTGELVPVRPGVVHRFSNPGSQPCRFLVQVSPPGIEDYFEEMARLLAAAPQWPPADLRPLLALGERFDIFPPPPPGA